MSGRLQISVRRSLVAVLGLAGTVWPVTGSAAAPCLESVRCRAVVPVVGEIGIPVYALWPMERSSPTVTRVVFVIHGRKRNAGAYFRRMVRAGAKAGALKESQILAPRFLRQGDGVAEGVLYWGRNRDWIEGERSAGPVSISAFAVLDRLRARLARRALYPNLRRVVIAGHSAGGQFVQRYAIGAPPAPGGDGPRLRFVVANPSSYMYLDGLRPDGRGGFAVVEARPDCAANDYKFGPRNRNGYLSATPLAELTERYLARDVVYLIGAQDNDPRAPHLDRSCPAMAQGPHRRARGLAFMAWLDRFHRPHNHRLVLVPDVGHSASRVFRSAAGIDAVFRD